jgi:23S rRNA (adenine2503-C2)-methyltransferase
MTIPFVATKTENAVLSGIEKLALERYVAPAKPSLVGLSRPELTDSLASIGVPERRRRMRVQQIWHWLYVRGAQDFDIMTTLSKELRSELAQHFTLARPKIVAEQVSADGTRKWLLRLPGEADGSPHEVECVYIPETDRGTLCNVWCVILRPAKSSARWCSHATGLTIGSVPRRSRAPTLKSGSSPMW